MRALFLSIFIAVTVSAHFEIVYTPTVEVEAKEVKLTNFFSHPYDGHHLMVSGLQENGDSMGIKEFFMIAEGKKIDLTPAITKVTYSTKETKAPGYDITLNKKVGFQAGGDYAIYVVPHPYFEASEGELGIYIQQITKLFINKGGLGESWYQRQAEGYTEILPLVRPYDITTGSLFRAQVVDNEGKPAAGVVVEVEYLNYPIDMKNHTFVGTPVVTNEKKGMATLITDANGIFSFIPQTEGYWGFAALFAGSEKEYKGKELEQSPVIWIQVSK